MIDDNLDENLQKFLETTRILEQKKLDEEEELLAEYDQDVKSHE